MMLKNNLFICLSIAVLAVMSMPSAVAAEEENNLISVPAEAFLPLGESTTQHLPLFDVGSGVVNMLTDTTSAGITKVAPGDLFPISINLRNFGGGQKVDVLITYQLINSSDAVVLTTSETVAVETTASFIKVVQIPANFTEGVYTAESSIKYLGQKVPATSDYQFTVERKILGLFKSDFYVYGGITLIISCICFALAWFFIRRRSRRGVLHDYADKPRDKRIYYEMVSDIITQMRLREGDRALEVAAHVEGLVVDKETGKVLHITENPAKVVAGLISGYDKVLGRKVSFSLRPSE